MSTFAIRPFPRLAVYPTGWAGELTFEQLYEDLARYASAVMQRFGVRPDQLPECLQAGFMALWETLAQQRSFLAQKSRRQTVFFILARCRISSMRYHERMYDRLDALISDDWHGTADELVIDGLQRRHAERWADWATRIDLRVDIERIMCRLAERHAGSFQRLFALYQVTTQVRQNDAAALVGVPASSWREQYALPMLAEVRYEFAQAFLERHTYPAPETAQPHTRTGGTFAAHDTAWREAYHAGDTAPAEALLAQYAGTPCLAQALRAQITGRSYRQAAADNGQPANSFKKHMLRAARLLRQAYAR
jgi:predicted kinase